MVNCQVGIVCSAGVSGGYLPASRERFFALVLLRANAPIAERVKSAGTTNATIGNSGAFGVGPWLGLVETWVGVGEMLAGDVDVWV